MKIIFTIALFGLCLRQGFSQNKLSGKFTDAHKKPVPYLEITASVSDSILRRAVTDTAGVFILSLPQGSYTLKARLFGKAVYEKAIELDKALDLGVIAIQTGVRLGEVAVTAQKKLLEQKIDRLVFHVENAIAAAGGDALDALKITPGLRVEDDKISMIGKGSLGVMVDGRLLPLSGADLTNYLQSISADDIKSIEVITTPPARYEAEGNSGLINILYKKGHRDAWRAQLRSRYIQTTYPAYGLGGSFSYHRGKWSLLLNTSAKTGAEAVVEHYNIQYPQQPWIGQMNRKDTKDYLSGRIALDYKLNKKNTIGFQYSGGTSSPDSRDTTVMNSYSAANTLDSLIQSRGFTDKAVDNHSLNLHYITQWDSTGKNLSIDLDYFKYRAYQDRNFVSQNYSHQGKPTQTGLSLENTSDQHTENYSAKVDVSYPTKWAVFSYGAKVSFTENDYETDSINTVSGQPKRDPKPSNRFQYRENTQALYLSASKKLNSKWQSKLGLRLENTQTQGTSKTLHQTHKNDYTQLFPSCYLTYAMDADQTFSLSYGRRIQRPPYWRLNPLRLYISSSFYAEGNPSLRPSFTDNIELSHNWKGDLSTRASFSATTDGFNRIPMPDKETKKQVARDENYYTLYTYGLSESYTFKKYAWWQSYNQVYAYYNRSELTRKGLGAPEQSGLSFYMLTYNTLLLNPSHTLKGEVDFWYSAPSRSTLFREAESYSLNLALKLLLLNKSLQISLGAYDLLKTTSPNYTTYTNGITQIYNSYFDNRYLMLSVSFKFGNDKIRVQKRDFGSKLEKQRAGVNPP